MFLRHIPPVIFALILAWTVLSQQQSQDEGVPGSSQRKGKSLVGAMKRKFLRELDLVSYMHGYLFELCLCDQHQGVGLKESCMEWSQH